MADMTKVKLFTIGLMLVCLDHFVVHFINLEVISLIDHFTVVCLVPWPLTANEAGGDLERLPFEWNFR